jgi:hypothetical protein
MRSFVFLGVFLITANAAFALTVDGSGAITNWGITPFTSGVNNSTTDNLLVGGVYRTLANNYAPINYPSQGYVPSGGEAFDFEEMYARFVGNTMEVLIISSSGYTANGFSAIKRGDLFVTLDGVTVGVVTQSLYGPGVHVPGSVYQILGASDVEILQNISGTYLHHNQLVANDYGPNNVIRDIAGPYAVAQNIDNAQLLPNTAVISTAVHSYGGAENNTNIFEYVIDFTGFPIPPTFFSLHQTWGCGNDVIQITAAVPPNIPDIPSPSAAMFGVTAMALLGIRRRIAA